MTNTIVGGRFFQNTRTYVVLRAHPSGRGSITIPGRAWVEGNFFQRFPDLKEGTPPAGAEIIFSESDFVMKGSAKPVTLPPIVKPHEMRPAIEVPKPASIVAGGPATTPATTLAPVVEKSK